MKTERVSKMTKTSFDELFGAPLSDFDDNVDTFNDLFGDHIKLRFNDLSPKVNVGKSLVLGASGLTTLGMAAHAETTDILSTTCHEFDERDCGARRDNNRIDIEQITANQEQHFAFDEPSSNQQFVDTGFRISIDGNTVSLPELGVDDVSSSTTSVTVDEVNELDAITEWVVEENIAVDVDEIAPVEVAQSVEEVRDRGQLQRMADVEFAASNIELRYDEIRAAPRLNIVTNGPTVQRNTEMEFQTYLNYPDFVERSEIRIFEKGASVKSTPLGVVEVVPGQKAKWLAETDADAVEYVYRVYDKNGRFDETARQSFAVSGHPYKKMWKRIGELQDDRTSLRNIDIVGGTVSVLVNEIEDGDQLTVMGVPVDSTRDGAAFAERIIPAGEHNVDIVIEGDDGEKLSIKRPVHIAQDDHFLVGLADLTLVNRAISGNKELVEIESEYDKEFVEGRLAFYYKGKIKGKYLLTASADTGEERIGDLFTNFTEKDSRSFLRRIDPERYYPVYGDDSTVVEDAPTSGKFYVRLDRGASNVLWGNFQTALTGTEFVNYSRSLYGASGHAETGEFTTHGEARAEITAFAADSGTTGSREEFRATAGSVYYMQNQDIVQGTERLFVEVRDRNSGIVESRRELVAGQDYDFNYIQGRVMLRQALPTVSNDDLFVRDGAIAGNPVFLVTTYEYVPTFFDPKNVTTGARGKVWLNDHVGLGASVYNEDEPDAHQTIVGADITVRKTPETYVKAEIAQADGVGSEVSSATGGFEFVEREFTSDKAKAIRLEAASNLSDLKEGWSGQSSVYYQKKEEGFSAPGQFSLNGQEVEKYGVALDTDLSETLQLRSKYDGSDSAQRSIEALEIGINKQLNERFDIAVGVRHDDRNNATANLTASPTLNEQGARTDANVQLGVKSIADEIGLDWEAFIFGQLSLQHDDTRQGNDRIGVGGALRISERATADLEVSTGELGLGIKTGIDYQLSDYGNMYLSYQLAGETNDSLQTGQLGRATVGTRTRYTDDVSVFAEGRYDHGDGPTGITEAYGIDWTPGEQWSYGLGYETGKITDELSGDIRREAVTASLGYSDKKVRTAVAVELREEQSDQTRKRTVWAWRSLLNYQHSENTRYYTKYAGSSAKDDADAMYDASFSEVVIGIAHRPVYNDKLNYLFKFTHLRDLPSPEQLTANGERVDYAQRSSVFSFDATYDVNNWLKIGGKYANRMGQLRATPELAVGDADVEWFESEADFVAGRVDINFVENWEFLGEVRRLSVKEAHDSRTGGLVALYRQIGSNFKVGVGYNFTDFSDDLTDLSYDEDGTFINLVGMF